MHILDWKKKLLPQAVSWLAGGWQGDGPLDLSDKWVIVPTRQSGRRLREALAAFAAGKGQAVFPPRVLMPETLLGLGLGISGIATRHDALFAWIEVLLGIRMEDFEEVFPVAPPEQNPAWATRLARQFLGLQSDLAESGMRIRDVSSDAGGPFPEAGRWTQLARLETLHDAALAKRGLRDLQAARIEGAHSPSPPDEVTTIVLLATPDPLPLAITILESLASKIDVQVVVYGPTDASAGDVFDSWGRPLPETWRERTIDPGDFDSQVHLCADPADQAARVAGLAASHARPDGIVAIGVADPGIIAPLGNSLTESGVASHDPEGVSRRSEPLYETVRLLAALHRDAAFEKVEQLARCPDILAWLATTGGPTFSATRFLGGLDELRATHLPTNLDSACSRAAARDPRDKQSWPEVEPALRRIASLVAELAGKRFPENIQSVLTEVFGHRHFDTANSEDVRMLDAAEAWATAVEETAAAAARFTRISDTDALEHALATFGDSRRFPDKSPGAIDLQGWLELLWEDAPHLAIVGLNDGRVPTAIVDDPFLPETLRERLGMKSNAERFARDHYILQALASCRSSMGRLDLLLGKTNAVGEPLRPSRLLLTCDDAELPRRVKTLFRELETSTGAIPWRRAWKLRPGKPVTIRRIPATGFRDYLQCPFRFYLKHGLRMQSVDPFKNELDALDFGNLCHHALEALGANKVMRDSRDIGQLREFLLDNLDQLAAALYGDPLPLTVFMQLESARQRLGKAAEVQAQLRSEGWVIQEVEWKMEFELGGMTVRGKIDRIDRHESTGEIRVLDYKTSDNADDPGKKHAARLGRNIDRDALPEFSVFEAGGDTLVWQDLQLPLYRRAVSDTFGAATCGYFNLPKGIAATGVSTWDGLDSIWQEAADRCADGVAAAVQAGRFWPPNDVNERFDDFAHLFHRGVEASVDWPEVVS